MNNFKKIGVSALAGSLAMVSANAVEYTMSGGMLATYTTQDGPASVEGSSGKAVGVATDLSFNASGELDNGWTVAYFMGVDTDGALSNTTSQMTVGMGSLGTLQLNNKFGSKANAIDDITPNAYNETWDGLAVDNPSFFGSSTTQGSIDYRIPSQSYAGLTVDAAVTYDPNQGVGPAAKAGVTATNSGSGHAYVVQVAHESGLSAGAGIEVLDDMQGKALTSDTDRATGYVKFASGGLTIAYQEAYENAGNSTATAGADREAEFLGVAYTMGDLTLSYGESELTTKAVNTTAQLATIELESLQAAYTMGAMTISAAISSTDNVAGVAGAKYDENTLAVSFAF